MILSLAQQVLNNDLLIIRELKQIIVEKDDEKQSLIEAKKDFMQSNKYPDLDPEIKELVFDYIYSGDQIPQLEREIEGMIYEVYKAEGKIDTGNWDDLVERVKKTRIESVIYRFIGDVNINRPMNCVFHKDKFPSLKIYPKTNSFHCFGCQLSGDPITFVRKLQNCGFKEAVEILSSF